MRISPETARGDLLIRAAKPEDAEAIQRLYTQLVPNSRFVKVVPERLSAIADDPNSLLLVVEYNGSVVATAFLTLCLDPMFVRQPFAVVENVVVDAAYRKRGCGRVLFEVIDQCALQADCSKIMLLSDHARREPHRFFISMGYAQGTKSGFVKYRRNMSPGKMGVQTK